MRGGKREGAGRKKVLTCGTTVIKIPLPVKDLLKSIVDYEISYLNQNGDFDLDNRYQTDSSNHNQLAKIQEIIKDYENHAHATSVRWDIAKKLIADLKKALS